MGSVKTKHAMNNYDFGAYLTNFMGIKKHFNDYATIIVCHNLA
jgi:hypothetical protein